MPFYHRLSLLLILLATLALTASCAALQPDPTPTPTPTETLTPTPSPTVTATSTATPTASPTATATATPSPTPTINATQVVSTTVGTNLTPIQTTATPVVPGGPWPTPDVSQATDHYWLARPTGPGTTQWASPFYPYGSTAQGALLLHHGADIANPIGTPLYAPADGVAVFAGPDDQRVIGPATNFFGNAVIIELDQRYHDQPVFVLLGHMSRVDVQPGQRVNRGQQVGLVGSSGVALGPHVHVEVRVGLNDYDHTRNSEFWLEPLAGHGTLAGRVLTADGRHLPNVQVLLYPGPEFNSPRYYAFTYTDALGLIFPDDEWGENVLLADLPAGAYRWEIAVNGKIYRGDITIEAGKTTWFELRTEG